MWYAAVHEETGIWLVLKPFGFSSPLCACEVESKDDAESIAYELNAIDAQIALSNKTFNVKIKYQIGEVL